MELKICCDASVKLEKMSNVMEVECNVGDYRLDGETLTGDIIIRGVYIQDVLEENHEFSEIVPFTIVFNENNNIVEGITIQDFSCQEIINHGIECNFNILVNYQASGMETDEELEKEIIEKDVEDDFSKEIEIVNEEDIIQVSDDDIKKEIDKKYDNLLNEILEARADQNFLEKSENIKVRSNEVTSDCRSLLKEIPEEYISYKVYYTNKESDIEKIAQKENVSVDKVYKDNKNNDIASKKRIIIK